MAISARYLSQSLAKRLRLNTANAKELRNHAKLSVSRKHDLHRDNARVSQRKIYRRSSIATSTRWLARFRLSHGSSGDRFQFPPTLLGRKGEPNEVETSVTRATSSVDDYGLDDVVPQADIDAARGTPYNPLAAAVELVTGLLLLDREKRVADLVTTAASYARTNKITLASNDQWSVTHADSDPYADITNRDLGDSRRIEHDRRYVDGRLERA